MSTETPSTLEFERPSTESTHSLMGIGFALRFAFIGISLSVAGVISLVSGGMDPLNAAVLVVCGGGVAWASIQYVRRWNDAESASERAAATASARTSMHQPVFSGGSKLQRQG